MITTQYGDPIDRIIHVDEKCGMCDVEINGKGNKPIKRTYMLHQLRADDGIKEILSAALSRRMATTSRGIAFTRQRLRRRLPTSSRAGRRSSTSSFRSPYSCFGMPLRSRTCRPCSG